MEYSNTVLKEIWKERQTVNYQFGKYYFRMFEDDGGLIEYVDTVDGKKKPVARSDFGKSYFNRGERISGCCNLWLWDRYEKNKLLDLKKLNRCRNSRFCPNCKRMNVSKFIHEFKRKIPELIDYDMYMLTTTIPSVDGANLRDSIDGLYKCFRGLNQKYNLPNGSKGALDGRLFYLSGGVRVLEITYNPHNGYHPHLHSIVCVPKNSIESVLLSKNIKGKYSRKRKSYNMKSDIDVQIGKVWTMLWYGIDFRKWDKVNYDPADIYLTIDGVVTDYKVLEVDFMPLDSRGIYEVFKYTFKSSDIKNYDVFRCFVDGLYNKRIRQGFGILYDMKCDDDSEGEKQPLVLEYEESPEDYLCTNILELTSTFADYKKISRFNAADEVVYLKNNLVD